MPTIEQKLDDAIAAQNALTQMVAAKKGEIDAATAAQLADFLSWKNGVQLDFPSFRLSKNQAGTLTGTALDFFTVNGAFPIQFSLVKTITSGVLWDARSQDEKDILTALGREGVVSFEPDIRVIKMAWSGNPGNSASLWTFYQSTFSGSAVTHGCVAKLISGSINGGYFEGITPSWGICGYQSPALSAGYAHPHPFASSPAGEVQFVWLGSIAGRRPLDRSNPRWGFFPHISASNGIDTTI